MKCALLFLFSLSVLSATAVRNELDSAVLVGEWGYERDGGFSVVLRFKADGTFDGHLGDETKQIVFAGTWERKGDRIHYIYSKPTSGQKDEDKIITIGPDYFIIKDLGGNQRRYHRLSNSTKQPNQALQRNAYDRPFSGYLVSPVRRG